MEHLKLEFSVRDARAGVALLEDRGWLTMGELTSTSSFDLGIDFDSELSQECAWDSIKVDLEENGIEFWEV